MLFIKALRYQWSAQSPLLIDIPEFSINQGESIFLKGASGSGKSTLLGLIAGIHLPTSGQLSILDTDLTKLSGTKRDAFRAEHLGIIFQQFNLLPYLSVVDNVLLPCQFSTRRKQGICGDIRQEAIRLLKALALLKIASINPSML